FSNRLLRPATPSSSASTRSEFSEATKCTRETRSSASRARSSSRPKIAPEAPVMATVNCTALPKVSEIYGGCSTLQIFCRIHHKLGWVGSTEANLPIFSRRAAHPSGFLARSTTNLGAPPLDFQGWDPQKPTPHLRRTIAAGTDPLRFDLHVSSFSRRCQTTRSELGRDHFTGINLRRNPSSVWPLVSG